MKLNKKKGLVFWITGLPGSGKTTIAKKIKKSIELKYGKTILFSGDDLRKIFNQGYVAILIGMTFSIVSLVSVTFLIFILGLNVL